MRINSPDEVLLFAMSKAMNFAHSSLGFSPLTLLVWPPLGIIAMSSIGYAQIALSTDPSYLFLSILCAVWCRIFWKDHSQIRADMAKEWSTALYKRYLARAEVIREGTTFLRITFLVIASLASIAATPDFGNAGLSNEMQLLSGWQRAIIPLNFWAVFLLSLARAAEPPPPDYGDFSPMTGRA